MNDPMVISPVVWMLALGVTLSFQSLLLAAFLHAANNEPAYYRIDVRKNEGGQR